MDGQPKKNESRQERLRSRWTSSQDKIFADLVVEQIQQGNRSNNVFDQKAWKHIRDQFNAQTGLNFNKKQLRKHLEVLRTRYHNLKSVSDQTSFSLDHSSHMSIPDFEIWGDLIEEPPKRETIKIKDCPIYDQLCLIFTETGCDGRYAQSSHYEGLETNAVGVDTLNSRSRPKSSNRHFGEGSTGPAFLVPDNVTSPPVTSVDMNPTNKRKRRSSETPSTPCHHLRDQDGLVEAMAEAMLEMVSASKLRASVTQPKARFTIGDCIKALDEIQGVDESLYFSALDLFDNPSERKTFMSLQSENQFDWLHDRCKNMSSASVV